MVEFTNDPKALELIMDIVERCSGIFPKDQTIYKPLDIEMDLSAAHVTCPMDFQKLLDSSDFDFIHDILGIRRYLNRKTGHLEDHFVPRCAR